MNKSYRVQFLLTLFLGPIGLFYSSVAAALSFLLVAVILASSTGGLGAFLIWPITIPVGFAAVANYNKRVALEEERHEELLRAALARRD